MPRARNIDIDFVRRMEIYARRGLDPASRQIKENIEEIHSLSDRLERLLEILRGKTRKTPGNMVYLILYDIEDNRVRTQLSKYLIKKGCHRIQKSVFITETNRAGIQNIRETLQKVNAMYQNEDSLIILPVAEDSLNAIQIIGKSINIDLALYRKNVIFI
jgi:CRISPR-associated endonuclease Cas2